MKNRSRQPKTQLPLKQFLTLLCLLVLVTTPRAQQPTATKQSPADRVALYQALLDLTNPWTVMCIAAHPDDEDGTSLIVMRRKYGAHTVSLFSTFGEGGQNAIGPELYEELGAIRARETMAAAEVQGSEPYFLGLKDFGYSKSADEAFKVWGHEEALRRMVLQIRKLRPDVIITNHSVTNNDHGQHQATARLTLEAFDAAADPKRFPEQLKDGVTVWQVQRLFVRAPRSAAQSTGQKPDREGGRNDLVTIDPNERDPIRDTSFAEEALRALHKHATQGPWPKTVAQMAARFTNSSDGRLPVIRYRLVRKAKEALALPSNSSTLYEGLRLPESLAGAMEVPGTNGRPLVDFIDDRSKVLNELIKFATADYRPASDSTVDGRLSFMRSRIARAAALAAGVNFHVEVGESLAFPGSTVAVRITITNSGTQPLNFFGCKSDLATLSKHQANVRRRPASVSLSWRISPGSSFLTGDPLAIPLNAPINVPISEHLYDPTGLGLKVITQCTIGLGGGFGDRFPIIENTRIDVAPAVEITDVSPSPFVMTPLTLGYPPAFRLKLTNHKKTAVTSTIDLAETDSDTNPRGAELKTIRLELKGLEQKTVQIKLSASQLAVTGYLTSAKPGRKKLVFSVTSSFRRRSKFGAISKIDVPMVYADAAVPTVLKIGYIRGFDYSLPNALDALGVESKQLSVDEVKTADLQKYTSVIVDNRVYESEPGLIEANQKLLDYAKAGGTLIVFYHKSFEWNPDPRRNRPELAPYKLILGDERVTDENAPITFLEPQHPLLNFPNKMGQEDFANWIQERGLYYPKEWDPQFHALLQSNDPGEAPLKGGLLVADYGRGRYIYTSMVWYRELRGGVPGAYRMLANMISYGARK
jgi:LmbE family N-acetylglucosaminyl deacetylase